MIIRPTRDGGSVAFAATRPRAAALLLTAIVILTACAPASTPGSSGAGSQATSAPRRLTAAILSDPKALGAEAGSAPGVDALRGLLHAGLASPDETDQLRAQLADEVPNVENGLWKLLPDGRMETTWKIRSNARWHDGTPFTSDDVVFTARVAQDRELPAFRDPAYQSVESIEAPDPLTVVVTWRTLNINADRLFPNPLPRHLLEPPAREGKPTFTQLPYWSQEFIGTGAFKLRDWVPGSHVMLDANDDYVLGRPKIDEIEVKFILNSSTLVTNLLAGVVELPLGRTLSFDQALELRSQWQYGRVEIVPRPGWSVIYPQFTYTNPPVVADVRFRRALLHAIDRQELVDTVASGFSEVADSFLPIARTDYAEIKARAPRYGYDPRRAAQLIAELGYARAGDGIFRDGAGQRLDVEIRTTGDNDANVKLIHPVVDYWQQIGVAPEAVLIAPQLQSNREYRATFPAFGLYRHPNDVAFLPNFTSARVATRENNWTGGDSGYHNPEFDALYDAYSKTIPMKDRTELLGQLIYHMADQVVTLGLLYDNLAAFIGSRTANVVISQQYGAQYTWSAYLWELKE
jgi:peptide/nickel transport system substrate-binding protein